MMWPQVRILQAIPANIIWPINQTHPLSASLFKKNIQEVGAPGKQKKSCELYETKEANVM